MSSIPDRESLNDHYFSRRYTLVLLLILGCGPSSTEILKPETISATLEAPKNRTAAITNEKATITLVYQNPIDVIDPKEVFGTYLAQDSVWVEKHQLFVNQEFDFAVAMSIPDIGAGVAAKKRQEANKKVGEQLTKIPAVNLQEAFEVSRAKHQSNQPEPIRASVVLYGLLFGDKKARLQSVLQVSNYGGINEKAEPTSIRLITVSEQKALTGEASWTSDNGAALTAAARSGIKQLVSLFYEYGNSVGDLSSINAEGKTTAKCPVGGNQKIKGTFVERKGNTTILRLDRQHPTLLTCESESLIR